MASTTCCLVRADTYRDSVELMRVAALVERLANVSRAALMMATPANRELLSGAGLLDATAAAAGPNDLVVAVAAADRSAGASYHPWSTQSLPPNVTIGADESLVRLVTSFATTESAIERFAAILDKS